MLASAKVPPTLRIAECALCPWGTHGGVPPSGGNFWSKVNTGLRMLLVAIPLQLILYFSSASVDDDDDGIADTYTQFYGYRTPLFLFSMPQFLPRHLPRHLKIGISLTVMV